MGVLEHTNPYTHRRECVPVTSTLTPGNQGCLYSMELNAVFSLPSLGPQFSCQNQRPETLKVNFYFPVPGFYLHPVWSSAKCCFVQYSTGSHIWLLRFNCKLIKIKYN